ncbi:MAG: polyphenol oxidase family protein [Actinomycetota bacterium]
MVFTLRLGGFSCGRYAELNLATHTGDDPECVRANREKLSDLLGIRPDWAVPDQVHGCTVVAVSDLAGSCDDVVAARAEYFCSTGARARADAVVVDLAARPVAVMVADCLPIALVGPTRRAVVHAGWRGLCSGVVEAAIDALGEFPRAWIGPAIGPCHFEVGADVIDAFRNSYPEMPTEYWTKRGGSRYFNLPGAARWVLRRAGAEVDDDESPCTWCDDRLFSYRRDGITGRQAVVAWQQ